MVKVKQNLPCCAKWQSASSMWRLIGEASLLAFCTIHGSAPSSIKRDLPDLVPVSVKNQLCLLSELPGVDIPQKLME